MSNTKHLNKAKVVKNDEFYTMISDIEKELYYYREQFKGATILLPCDDPELIPALNGYERIEKKASQFWVYFHLNFKHLGVKEIIATHYSKTEKTYGIRYTGGDDSNIYDFEKFELEQNGDFRSPEIKQLMKEADFIITNPPFSLFREFVDQLMNLNKKFLIIGNKNSYNCKNIFKYMKNHKLWSGYTNVKEFLHVNKDTNEIKIKKFGNVGWFTNLNTNIIKEELHFHKKYNPIDYPKYDSYDAINIDRVKDIPYDYFEEMGVPISFLDKINFKQFEIIGLMASTTIDEYSKGYPFINGKKKFSRIIIKRKDRT